MVKPMLLYAADVETASLLLQNGADLHIKSLTGRTPLDCAVQEQKIEIVRLFISKGADVNYIQPPGKNNFYTMTQWSLLPTNPRKPETMSLGLEILATLLKAGANPNQQNFYGRTALYHACINNGFGGRINYYLDFIKLLLAYGADPCIRDINNKSCFEAAKEYPEVLELLEPYKTNLRPPIPIENWSNKIVKRLIDIGYRESNFKGCSEEEITALEKAQNVKLPKSYKEFLRLMGHGAGGFMSASDHWEYTCNILYDDWFGLNHYKLSEEDKDNERCINSHQKYCRKIPANLFVFASRLGHDRLCFVADGINENPEIYNLNEFDELSYHCPSIWNFVSSMVEYEEYYHHPRGVKHFAKRKHYYMQQEAQEMY